MSDRFLIALAMMWMGYALMLSWFFFHPTYNWTPREVAREHIYDYEQFPLRK